MPPAGQRHDSSDEQQPREKRPSPAAAGVARSSLGERKLFLAADDRIEQFAGGLQAVPWVDRQHGAQKGNHLRWDFRGTQSLERQRFLDLLRMDFLERFPEERRASAKQVPQSDTKRIDVRAAVDPRVFGSRELLRAREGRRADKTTAGVRRSPFLRVDARDHFGQAEIDHFDQRDARPVFRRCSVGASMRLEGFRSRCTMPRASAAANARAT